MTTAGRNELGKAGEEAAARYLMFRDYSILARNWRAGGLEIDIVAQKRGVLVFVEVKTLGSGALTEPEEKVDAVKQARILRAARAYMGRYGLDQQARFDVISVTGSGRPFNIRHTEDAFGADPGAPGVFSGLPFAPAAQEGAAQARSGYAVSMIRLGRTDSTNARAAALPAPEEGCMTVVTAESQTAGRGQGGAAWVSEAGENLLFSVALTPKSLSAKRQFALLQAQSLALCDAAGAVAGGVSIKWPNDIYINGRKAGGTLAECDIAGGRVARAILGTGLNVNQRTFPPDIPNPTSLRLETGRELDRETLLENIIERLAGYCAELREGRSLDAPYFERLYRRGGTHRYRDAGGVFEARIMRTGEDGRLVLADSCGRERSYGFKEVEFLA